MFGQAMKTSRASEDMTQAVLAERVGTSRQTIMNLESGMSNPGYMLAFLISRRLGFSLDETIPNITDKTCVCHLFGPAECKVCHPHGYVKK